MGALPNSFLPSLFFLFTVVSPVAAADQAPSLLPHQFPHRFKSIHETLFIAAPSPPPPEEKPIYSPFRPSRAAVVVVVLTATFSITFLLLLYAKHCNRGNAVMVGFWRNPNSVTGVPSFTAGKNSGIDQSVIESLPMFRFGSMIGQKEELECAVCLNKFEQTEILRLLPKCKHVFHVECVDTWLDAHSTCPLCRYRVDPEDVLLVDVNVNVNVNAFLNNVALNLEQGRAGPGRISGRHSSVGEKRAGGESSHRDPALLRRSLDGYRGETVAFRGFDRPRKDGLLLPNQNRLDHRIIEWPAAAAAVLVQGRQRWSDVQPSDLVYLRSEMIMSDSRRFSITEKQSKKQSNPF